MLIVSPGHVAFAVTMIALGILGLIKGDFAPIWQPVSKGVPGREVLAYLCAFVSLACGMGCFGNAQLSALPACCSPIFCSGCCC